MRIVPSDQKSRDILHAVRKLLVKKGFAATTFKQIAQEAGVSCSRLRYYFKNKEELLSRVIQENIKKITSSFSLNLSSSYLGLSPREIQVADLVRQGRANKEAARILNISVNAVEFHRNNLRKKLGLQNKKINLRTYLLSMQ